MTDLNLIPTILFFGVLSYMIFEDYHFQTVDLRGLILLILFGLCATNSKTEFVLSAATGLLFFRIMYLATTKLYLQRAFVTEGKFQSRSPHGYLPSLGVAIVLFLILSAEVGIPKFFVSSFAILEWDEIILTVVAAILILIFFEYRIYRAEKKNLQIIHGFGNGDVYVLALLSGLVGMENLLVIFIISLFVQLAEFCYSFFKEIIR